MTQVLTADNNGSAAAQAGTPAVRIDRVHKSFGRPGAATPVLEDLTLEVDEADAAEQTRDVGYDDEDYR